MASALDPRSIYPFRIANYDRFREVPQKSWHHAKFRPSTENKNQHVIAFFNNDSTASDGLTESAESALSGIGNTLAPGSLITKIFCAQPRF
jgi:hypothetical protein